MSLTRIQQACNAYTSTRSWDWRYRQQRARMVEESAKLRSFLKTRKA